MLAYYTLHGYYPDDYELFLIEKFDAICLEVSAEKQRKEEAKSRAKSKSKR